MKELEISNYKQFWISVTLVLIGIVIVLVDVYNINSKQLIFASLGVALITSSLVSIINLIFIEKVPKNPIDEWKITKIYSNRQEKDLEDNNNISRFKGIIDIIAFGLSSFREKNKKGIMKFLEHSGNTIRILTMHPNSSHLIERDIEENKNEGYTRKTINDLVQLANELNSNPKLKGKIIIKGYHCMTLDFYWKMGSRIYMGPYWYKKDSQHTITYKFEQGGKGYKAYSEYFEELWNDNSLSEYLTNFHE